MTLREKLLLLVVPLIVLPPVVVATVLLPLFGAGRQSSSAPYYVIASAAIVVTLGVGIFMAFHIARNISHPLGLLTHEAMNVSKGDFGGHLEIPDTASSEAHILAEAIEKMKSDLKVREAQGLQDAAHIAAGKLASQVAHDLAGPLSSLQVAVRQFKTPNLQVSEQENLVNLLDLSANRLATISTGLLDHYKSGKSREKAFSLYSVLDELVGEYQIQDKYRSVEFIKEYGQGQILLFGDRSRLQRAFANIIKNAIEAMEDLGSIAVQVCIMSDVAQVSIKDIGPGMSEELISRIAIGGVTHGKKDGHGIGMSVVREVVDEYGGELKIESEMGMGTTFTIMLPLPLSTALRHVERDDHLVEQLELNLDDVDSIVVVDDDASIRLQWQMIFEKIGWSCEQYESWEELGKTLSCRPSIPRTFFVLDYHFDNSLLTGIDIAHKLRTLNATHMILATAEYWKPSICDAARRLDIALCPKPLPKVVLASGVIATPETDHHPEPQAKDLSVLLIDDDPSIQKSWQVMQKILGIGQLAVFSRLEELITAAITVSDYDLCVIDKNIEKSQYDGAQMLNYLKEKGARRVFLATGEQEDTIRSDPAYGDIDGILSEKVPMSLEKYLS